MMTIKFSRTGRKNYPYFRIIILDKQKDPWGRFVENLGNYNPRTKELVIDKDSVKSWMSKGAEATKSVHNLFVEKGLITGKKVKVSRITKKRRGKIDKAAAEAEAKKPVAKEQAPEPVAEAPKAE